MFARTGHASKKWLNSDRTNSSQMFFKICVLKNFKIFTGKNLRLGCFLIKLQAWKQDAVLKTCNFIKKGSDTGVFLSNFLNFLRIPFSTKHLPRLLLSWVCRSCKSENVISFRRDIQQLLLYICQVLRRILVYCNGFKEI